MKRLPHLSTPTRARLYETGLALIGVAAVYGIVSDAEAAAWALVLAPVLGVARANVRD